MNLKKLIVLFIILFLPTQVLAKESNNHQFNFFTGNFDFSDDKQAAVLVGPVSYTHLTLPTILLV